MKQLTLLLILSIPLFFGSCQEKSKGKETSISYKYNLVKAEKSKSFPLDSDTEYNAFYLYNFKDEKGREYLSFLNYRSNQILFYDFSTCNFLFKMEMPQEGENSIPQISGYYIKDFDNMYVSSFNYPGLIKIDTTQRIVSKIPYSATKEGYQVVASYVPSSFESNIPVFIGNKAFITQGASRVFPVMKTPISIAIDTITQMCEQLPFVYGDAITEKHHELSSLTSFSRVFNGSEFVYSFHGNENIFITSVDHTERKEINVKSRYIDKIKLNMLPSSLNLAVKKDLETARYGSLVFDEYRDVYYRFAYHDVELENDKEWAKGFVFGRKKFSVIILDKQFNIIGETLFPEGIYNSYIFFVNEDGLYISSDYQINYDQSEDALTFELFDLVKEK